MPYKELDLHADVLKGESGPLGRFLYGVWKNEASFIGPLSNRFFRGWRGMAREYTIRIQTVLPIYQGDVPLSLGGDKDWKLYPDTYILTLHFAGMETADLTSLTSFAGYLRAARAALGQCAGAIKPHQHEIPYVCASSNARLIQTLMRMVPGFQIVDHLPLNSLMTESIIEDAVHHDGKFVREVAKLPFPVVVIPTSEFIKQTTR